MTGDITDPSLTKKIQKVIDDHYADRKAMSTGWYLISEGMDEDGDRIFGFYFPDEQSIIHSSGLMQFAHTHCKMKMASAFGFAEEEYDDND